MPGTRAPAVTPAQFTTFGDLLKFLRRRAGLTQRELSIALGYSTSQISRLEQNERPPDAASLAARFVPALQLETEPDWAARLLELAAASRTDEAPPRPEPAPLSFATPNNLPIQLTSFIGRESDIAQVKEYLAASRLVTLTGPGGAGESRLTCWPHSRTGFGWLIWPRWLNRRWCRRPWPPCSACTSRPAAPSWPR